MYLIGYRSANTASDGKWRKVKVGAELVDARNGKLTRYNTRTRQGYYAPASAGPVAAEE
jgi:hypothetical protein